MPRRRFASPALAAATTSAAGGVGLLALVLAGTAIAASGLTAQEIDRDSYLSHLPLSLPRLGPASPASAELGLFGDPDAPGYRDVAPRDGIDDQRYRVLQALALRFSPILVQNTSDIPTRFQTYWENREVFALHIDTWDVSDDQAVRLGEAQVNLSALGRGACRPELLGRALETRPEATTDGAIEDCKMLEALDRFAPGTGRVQSVDDGRVRSDPSLFEVVFLNFPGDGPESWDEGYEAEYRRTPEARRAGFPHTYVHPFVHAVTDESGATTGYELIFQYWWFYPSNDSGMNHEGDWEHMNVVVSPRSGVEAPMDAATVRRILSGELTPSPDAPDPLVIRRVDAYFHDLVMPLDFSRPNVYLPRDEWQAQADATLQTRFREEVIWKHLRDMAWLDDAETIVNTHPIGYIGSDNKGLNQAMEMPGGSNRNSHGTFPLPGRYNNVGPGGTTDQIHDHLETRRILDRVRTEGAALGPTFRRGSLLGFADPARMTLLPDWERLVEPVLGDPAVRAEWAWFLMPARWGYPATASPFSGIIANYNTGNVAPPGPSFSSGWNATGPTSSFKLYEPHTIPSVFPLQVQDAFRNDLGFLNLTIPTLLNLPPLDFVARVVAYPFKLLAGHRDPVYYPREGVPFRFVGLSSGVSIQDFGDDYNALAFNDDHRAEFLARPLIHLLINGFDSTTTVVGGRNYKERSTGTFIQIPFYIGGRFTSENTLRNVRSRFGAEVEFSNVPTYDYSADINLWEYAGSLRYSLTQRSLAPYLKAGYGWSWYRLENVQSAGVPFEPASSAWMGPENIWPNVWHYGLGAEFVPVKRVGRLPGGLEFAVRAEFVRYTQHLGLDLSKVTLDELRYFFTTLADVPSDVAVSRNDILLGFTITF